MDRKLYQNTKFEVLTQDGFKDFDGVLESIVVSGTIKITLENGNSLECTPDHKIFNGTDWKEAKSFQVNDLISTDSGLFKVSNLETINGEFPVYDLGNVRDNNSFYANGLQVKNCVLLDEFAHIEPKLAEKFWTSTLPVISSGKTSKIIIVSTPAGINLFHDLWVKANMPHDDPNWNNFIPTEVHWSEVPGRDQAWADKMMSILGEEKFDQEFCNSFIGTQSSLISSRFLKQMIVRPPLHSQNGLDVFEDPKVDTDPETGVQSPHAYVMCVDTGRGKQLDYSALTVIDVTDAPYKVVAKYRSNTIPVTLFADTIVPIAKRFNNAHILIEMDGPGYQVADDLHHIHEYENILMVATKGRSGQILATGFGNTGKNVQRGVKMSSPVRRTGCSNLKTLIETKRLTTCDHDIIRELSTFSLKGDRYEAEENQHDDLVMTLVTFSWLTTQKHFRDLMEAKIRQSLQEEYSPSFEHDLTPFGYIPGDLKDEGETIDGDPDKNLWFRAGEEIWKDYEEQQYRQAQKFNGPSFDRLKSHFGWD